MNGLSLVLVLTLLVPTTGCGKKRRVDDSTEATAAATSPATTPAPKVVVQAPAQEKDPNAGLSGLARVWTEQETKNRFRQIGLAYHNYMDTFKKAPAKAADLAPFYEKDAKITEALDKGWIVFLYNVRPQQMTQGTSNTVVAYENEPDRLGMRWVLMGDASVSKASQQEFDKMPKAGK
jgi:hypothetical protein